MSAERQGWFIQLRDQATGLTLDDDEGYAIVMNPGVPTGPQLYSDDNGTTVTGQVVTLQGGAAIFWTDRDVTAVDVSLLTKDGYARFLKNIGPSFGGLAIDRQQAQQMLVFPFLFNSAVETSTGLTLPAGCAIDPEATFIKVDTNESAKTIEVGFLSSESSGDPDGLIDAASLATAGYPAIQATLGDLINSSTTNGAAILRYVTNGTNKTLTYTCSSGTAAATGYVFLTYLIVP